MSKKKTILIAIDFYKNSIDAFHYAVEYALQQEIEELILLNCLEYEENRKHALEEMDNLIADYKDKVNFNVIVSDNNLALSLQNIQKEKHIDFVFMGITGQNKIGQKLIGSQVFELMQSSKTPLWIIPEDTKYQKIEHAALALPFLPNLKSITPYQEIKTWLKENQSKLTIINVGSRREEKEQVYNGLREMFEMFDDIEPAYHFPSGGQVADLILEYINKNSFQVLINMSGTYGVLERLFSPSVTKKLAYNSPVPFIIYPRVEK